MHRLLEGLNAEQQQVVLHNEGPVLVNAVAGSGKTRSVVHRIAYLIDVHRVSPQAIFATTFSRKAAAEMSLRLKRLLGHDKCEVRTFHSFCGWVMREEMPVVWNYWKLDEGDYHEMVKDAVGHKNLKLPHVDITAIESLITLCKAEIAMPETDKAASMAQQFSKEEGGASPSELIDAYKLAEKFRIDRKVLSFDDWLLEVEKLFRERENVRRRWADRFEYVLQDECQDQSYVQARIVKMLTQEHLNYMFVGDVSQCVYAFRGARPDIMISAVKELNATTINMNRNYRSGEEIIAVANDVLDQMDADQKLDVKMIRERSDPSARVMYVSYETQDDEGDEIASQMMELHEDGLEWRDMCVLYRANYLSRAIEEALIKLAIPYQVFGGTAFYARKECRDLLAYLRIATRREGTDIKDVRRSLNRPNRFLGKAFLEAVESEIPNSQPGDGWAQVIERAANSVGWNSRKRRPAEEWVDLIMEVRERCEALEARSEQPEQPAETQPEQPAETDEPSDTPGRILQTIVNVTGFNDWLRREEGRESTETDRTGNIAELIRAADKFPSVSRLLDHVDETIKKSKDAGREEPREVDKVSLMTVHRAKGLEFKHVYLITCNQGVMPHVRGKIHEERRIMYVAVTRAMDMLHISWVRKAASMGKIRKLVPSEFLRLMPTKEAPIPSMSKIIGSL